LGFANVARAALTWTGYFRVTKMLMPRLLVLAERIESLVLPSAQADEAVAMFAAGPAVEAIF
jgi:hypothetical protein